MTRSTARVFPVHSMNADRLSIVAKRSPISATGEHLFFFATTCAVVTVIRAAGCKSTVSAMMHISLKAASSILGRRAVEEVAHTHVPLLL